MSVKETAIRLGVSPRLVAAMLKDERLPSVKVGRRRLIPVSGVTALLGQQDNPIARALGDVNLTPDEFETLKKFAVLWRELCDKVFGPVAAVSPTPTVEG